MIREEMTNQRHIYWSPNLEELEQANTVLVKDVQQETFVDKLKTQNPNSPEK